ncbi:MAG: TetR/AcrR family transcriptional regulator, partial [Candidatus Binatia bacterium]
RSSWRQDPQGRRSRVLTNAAQLFGERGYREVRTGDIARAAGVAEGTLYYYFGSKNGLLQAAAEHYGRGLVEAMFDGVEGNSPGTELTGMIRRTFAYVGTNDTRFGVFLLAADPTNGRIASLANREVIVDRLALFFARLKDRGLIRPSSPRIQAKLCFGLVEAALRECFVDAEPATEGIYIHEVVECINGMLGL